MIFADFASGITLPDLRPLHEWAATSVRFPGSPIADRYDPANVPFLTEPLAAWHDPTTWAVSCLAGVQGCKTGLQQVAVARAMACRPGNILATMQDDEEAKFYNLTKLAPCLRASPATRAIVAPLTRNEMTKEHILLPGMFVQTQGAQALGGMQSKTIPYLLNDEVWRFPLGTMGELIRRTAAVRNRKVLSTSQGGEEKESRVEGELAWCEWGDWWHQGTCEVFEVACPSCPEFFPLQLRNYDGKPIVCWTDDETTRNSKTKTWKWSAVRASVRVMCPHCGSSVADTERARRQLVQKNRYVATNDNPSPGHRSFRWSGFALWWRNWADLAELFLRAMDALKYGGNIEPLKAFVQKEEADFWRLKQAEVPVINDRAPSGYTLADYVPKEGEKPPLCDFEIFEPHPNDASKTTLGIPIPRRFLLGDLQNNRICYVLRAYSLGRSRLLAVGEVSSFDDFEALQIRYGVPSNRTTLDCGFMSATVHYECWKRGWVPTTGRDVRSFTKTIQKGIKRGKTVLKPFQCVIHRLTGKAEYFKASREGALIKVYEFSNVYFKDILSQLRQRPTFEIPDDVPDFYLASMDSERKDGKGVWREFRKNKNHWWDMEVVGLMMASGAKLLGDAPPPEAE